MLCLNENMDVVSQPASLLKFATAPKTEGAPPSPSGPDRRDPDRAMQIQRGRDVADHFKRMETLSEVLEPIGMGVGVVSHAGELWQAAGSVAHSVSQGDLAGATVQANGLVKDVVDPEGGAGEFIHKAGQVMKATSLGVLGSMEIHQAVKNRDLSLGILGGAEVVMGLSAAAASLHQGGIALGLCAVSSVAKAGMMIARPQDYSRLQKVTTACEIGEAVGETLLEAGVAPLAALALRVGAPVVGGRCMPTTMPPRRAWTVPSIGPRPACAVARNPRPALHVALAWLGAPGGRHFVQACVEVSSGPRRAGRGTRSRPPRLLPGTVPRVAARAQPGGAPGPRRTGSRRRGRRSLHTSPRSRPC